MSGKASSGEAPSSSLSPSVIRGLTDKLVERRKGAALELERLVKDMVMMNDFSPIKQVIFSLEHDFTLSSNSNSRKGGLVGLAATAIALGRACIGMHLPELVQPVLTCFEDQDARVRYYACESLYNISKVARGATLVFFNNIFEGLCKLSCDSDSNVRYGAELLDRLMKDIVSENPHFDIDNFILLLRNRIYTHDGFARQFLVSWISFLDSVPDIHMHEHVPEFLDGLFCILGDQRKEIRNMAKDTLGELLREIEQHTPSVRFEAMANIIAVHSQSEDEQIQFTALIWLKVFLDLAQRSMMVFTANFLVSILPCVAYDSSKAYIRDAAFEVNDRLKKLILPEDDSDTTTDSQDGATSLLVVKPPPPAADSTSVSSSNKLAPPASNESTTTPNNQSSPKTSQSGLKTGQSSPKMSPKSSPKMSPKSSPKTSHKASQSSPETSESSPVTDQAIPEEKSPAQLVLKEPPRLHLLSVLGVLIPHTKFTQQETRLETLRWVMWLHQQLPKRVYKQAAKLFPALLEMLTDQSDKVVRLALQVISILSSSEVGQEAESSSIATPLQAKLASKPPASPSAKHSHLNKFFRLFLIELLKLFDADRTLLEKKGGLIIRQLCVYIDAHLVYCLLAEILYAEENLGLAALMVQVLNMILFTSTELYQLRMQLKELASPGSWSLFATLYRCWCHNPVATVALCLLTQNYDHAANLVQRFSDIEITSGLLKEIDKLVQLIESPIFSFLRLQLLVPHEHASLVRALYGLLMLLPQSTAFTSLRQRLGCVSVIMEIEQETKPHKKKPHRPTPSDVSFDELLEHFVSIQQKHSAAKRKATVLAYRNAAKGYK